MRGRIAAKYWFNGKIQTIKEVAAELGVTYLTAQRYLEYGMASSSAVERYRAGDNRSKSGAKKAQDVTPQYDSFIEEMLSWEDE